jgi:hypothetical protein
MDMPIRNVHRANRLFPLSCACQNLRRLTRIVTRIYDQELRKADIEITQFGLLTALGIIGEANQKALSAGFAMDSTTRKPGSIKSWPLNRIGRWRNVACARR